MTLRERLEWLTRMTFLLFILASAAFLSAITAMRIAIHGREVTMPNLVGKNVSEASQLLQSRGLMLRVADRIYSDQPINVVVRQTPPSGLLMKVSQQAHVVLSLGQRQLQIPLIEGNSLRASRIELLRGGLQVGEVAAPPRRRPISPQGKLRHRPAMAPRRRDRPVAPRRGPHPRLRAYRIDRSKLRRALRLLAATSCRHLALSEGRLTGQGHAPTPNFSFFYSSFL
jgi:hypothetical protein